MRGQVIHRLKNPLAFLGQHEIKKKHRRVRVGRVLARPMELLVAVTSSNNPMKVLSLLLNESLVLIVWPNPDPDKIRAILGG